MNLNARRAFDVCKYKGGVGRESQSGREAERRREKENQERERGSGRMVAMAYEGQTL